MSRYAQIAGGVVVAFLPGPPERWPDLHAAGALVPAWDDVGLGWVWDGAALTPPPARVAPPVSASDFAGRFTDAERGAITLAASRALEVDDPTLQLWLDDLSRAKEVHLDSPKVLAGLNYLVEHAIGGITQERIDAILAG